MDNRRVTAQQVHERRQNPQAIAVSHDMMRAEVWLQDTLTSASGLEELAQCIGYSPSQIRRRFREVFGIPPGAYRETLRMRQASRMLSQTPLSIRDVSRGCGYTNHSAFTRAFQRHFGQTPRRHRQNRQLDLRLQLRHTKQHFSYKTQDMANSYAILKRLYNASISWENLSNWEQNLNLAPMELTWLQPHNHIAVIQDESNLKTPMCLDLGIQTHSRNVLDLALPPAFRLIALPSQRVACLYLDNIHQLGDAVCFMSCQSFTGEGESLKGEPFHVVPQQDGLELRFPIQ